MSPLRQKRHGERRISALLFSLLSRVGGWIDGWRKRRQARCAPKPAQHHSSLLHFEALEPRILLSADLVGGSLSHDALTRVVPGDHVSALFAVHRPDSEALASPIRIQFYASADSVLDADDTLVGETEIAADGLALGANSITVPLDTRAIAQPGHYSLIGVIDPDAAIAESDESNNQAIAAQPLDFAFAVGQLPGRSPVPSLELTDADGTHFALAISGPGSAELTPDGSAWRLAIRGSDASTRIELTGSGGDGRIVLAGITAASPLGSVVAPLASLNGPAGFATLNSLSLGDIAPGASVAGSSLSSLSVSRDALGDLRLSGSGMSGFVLGSAQVGGALGGLWVVNGRGNSISSQTTQADWRANFSAPLTQLVVRGDASGQFAASALQILQVAGSLRGMTVRIGANLGSDAVIGGSGSAADQFGPGTLARLRVSGDLIDSRILIGIDPRNGIDLDGDDQQLSTPINRVQELLVGGQLKGDTQIVAPAFPASVRVAGVTLAPSALSQLASTPPDHSAPTLDAALLDDSGESASDRITRDPRVSGQASDAGSVSRLLAALDPTGAPLLVDLSSALLADGRFVLTAAILDTLAGGALADGGHTLRLLAEDAAGNRSAPVEIAFTLDRSAPGISLSLDPAFDSGEPGDGQTTAEVVDLLVSSESGSHVQLLDALGQPLANAVADLSGSVRFAGLALRLGENRFSTRATDTAGNSQAVDLTLTRALPDVTAPVLTLQLASDSGTSDHDRITNDARVIGTVSDASPIASLRAGFGEDPAGFISLLDRLQLDGSFTLDAARLAAINGGMLPDGDYLLHLRAGDAAANTTDIDLAFTIDTTPPVLASFTLDPESDTGTIGDRETSATLATLLGQAEAGTTVRLAGSDLQTTADASGAFRFGDRPLLPGENAFAIVLTDLAGNAAAGSLTVTRVTPQVEDHTAPTLAAGLLADTGRSARDGITREAAITGAVADDRGVTVLRAGFGSDPAGFVDILDTLQGDGHFTLDAARLAVINGGALPDGSHRLQLVAEDAAGNPGTSSVAFTLDTQAPPAPTFGLATSSDSGVVGDAITNAGVVSLLGTAEEAAQLTLSPGGLSALAGAGGVFQFANVALTVGDNALTLIAADAAGNESVPAVQTLVREGVAAGDAVGTWHAEALDTLVRNAEEPPAVARTLAIESLAVLDVINAFEGTPAFAVKMTAPAGAILDAAIAGAAQRVLVNLYPAQSQRLDARLAASLAAIAEGQAKSDGLAFGQALADAILATRASDGYRDFVDYPGSTAPGAWRPTGPTFALAALPQWADVTPFVLTSPDALRPPAPPALDSAEYAADVEEARRLGGTDSAERTADQTQTVFFWADGLGTTTPGGHWNQIAAQIADAQGLSAGAKARLFAELNVALADADVAAWDAKYTYGLWRPETAIQNADADGNDATAVDANWRPLLITPNHPEYVSGHSTYSAAAARVLASVFGEDFAFDTGSPGLAGVTRHFASFEQAAQEAGRSRIYGGIHYQLTNETGQTLGHEVAAAVLARFALAQDTQAPSIALDASRKVTSTNLTLSGRVLDNISGVASLEAKLDDGAFAALSFDDLGRFNFVTTFALDGTADDTHTLMLRASDAAGNASPLTTFAFTLDTRAPTITLTSPAADTTLTADTRLQGNADPNGSTLVALSYALDGGTAKPLSFDAATGDFDSPIELGDLAVGTHTFSLRAVDAAGNVSVVDRSVTLEALAPFTLTQTSPVPDSEDVGATFRPQVFFSRAVDAATLTADTFYATDTTGATLPAHIVVSKQGNYAWLFFTGPMPGASTITVHLKGTEIRAAVGGQSLDADGNGTADADFTYSFSTVNLASVPGTLLRGKVVDPGEDLEPMTFDDLRRGPDGIPYTADDIDLHPLTHVEVYVLGRPDLHTFTDADGNFELADTPVGDVKVVINGRTATNAPAGFYFPEMTMDVTLEAGRVNTMMGSMGSREEMAANEDRLQVYLPRLQQAILRTVKNTQAQTITLDPTSAPNLTPEQIGQLRLEFQPGSLIGEDGLPMDTAQIGISVVPPELVRDMLPLGVLQHTFDITIQAPGVATFAEPVQITSPNVFHAAPGTKLSLLSFDHTTGMLVINGSGTVSADGLTVVSDPDSGIRAPGWHGWTPPGSCAAAPTPPLPPHIPHPNDTFGPLQETTLPLIIDEGGSFNFPVMTWTAPDPLPGTPPTPPGPTGCPQPAPNLPGQTQPYIQVNVTVDGPLGAFMKKSGDINIAGDSFTLRAGTGQSRTLDMVAKSFAELSPRGIKDFEKNVLFGTTITIKVVTGRPDGSTHTTTKEILLTRYVDATDDNHIDGQTTFTKVVADGWGSNLRAAPVELRYGSNPTSIPRIYISGGLLGGSDFDYSIAHDELWFDPISTGIFSNVSTDSFTVRNNANFTAAGTVKLRGEVAATQYMKVDTASIESALASIATMTDTNVSYPELSAVELALIDTPAERTAIATAVANAVYAHYAPYAAGLQTGTSSLFGDLITIKFSTYSEAGNARAGLYGDSSPAGGVDNVFTAAAAGETVSTVINNVTNYSKAEATFRLDNAMNITFNGVVNVHPDTHMEFWDLAAEPTGALAAYTQMLADTAAHEYGHTLSLAHTYKTFGGGVTRYAGATGKSDLMMGHAGDAPSSNGVLTFTDLTQNPLLMSTNLYYTANQASKAIDYYYANIVTEGGFAVVGGGDAEEDEVPKITFTGPQLALFDLTDGSGVFDDLGFGLQTVDGAGGSLATRQLRVSNYGTQDLTIANASLGNTAFTLNGLPANTVIAAGQGITVSLSFDPTSVGAQTGTLTLASNAPQSLRTIALNGFGQGTGPSLTVDFEQNNLGSLEIDAGSTSSRVTLRNDGATPLQINDLSLLDGLVDFAVFGVPANLTTNPITLDFGQSFSFDISFDPSQVGLSRATIAVSSNDVNQPLKRISAVGTGFDDTLRFGWGGDFVAVSFGGNAMRTTSGSDGRFEFFLPADSPYSISVFDPESGLIAHGSGTTASSNVGTDLASGLVFQPSTAPDGDGDGLPDDIEFAIGSSSASRDTDKDGLDDFTETSLNLNPLDSRGVPAGVRAVTTLAGEAKEVVLAGRSDGVGGQMAYVATGPYGLAVLDVRDMRRPIVAGQIALPGDAVDVSLDTRLAIAAVATGTSIEVVDVSNPRSLSLARSIPIAASQVEVVDGVAYASVDSNIESYDLLTGVRRAMIPSGVGTIVGLAADRDFLFALDSAGRLASIDISGYSMVTAGTVDLSARSGRIFVGGGIAYVGGSNGTGGGFVTVDVSNPHSMVVLSAADNATVAGRAIVANGSGLGVAIGESRKGVETIGVVDVVDVSNPSDTGVGISRFALPSAPDSVAIGSGLAFIADGTSGLVLASYLPFDTLGLAPAVTLGVPRADADPAAPGVQVPEGATIALDVGVSDDRQIARVEVLLDGKVVSSDVAFPWPEKLTLPKIAGGDDRVQIQVRASDTGGNVGLSAPIEIQLVRDTVAPAIVSTNRPDGAVRGTAFRLVSIEFSEGVDPGTITPGTVVLSDSSGTAVVPQDMLLRRDGRELQLTYPALAEGRYQLRLVGPAITDRAGNALDTADIVTGFTISDTSTVVWIGGNAGFWDDVSNWSSGRLPGASEDVLIDVAPGGVIEHRSGETAVRSLTTNANFRLSGGTLTLEADSSISGAFSLAGGSVDGNGILTLHGTGNRWDGGTMSGNGTTRVASGADFLITGRQGVLNLTDRTLVNEGTIVVDRGGSYFEAAVLNLSGPVTIRNQGSFEIRSGASIGSAETPITGEHFDNRGLLRVAARSGMGLALDNAGTLELADGAYLTLGSASPVIISGSLVFGTTSSLDLRGNYTLAEAATITGNGNLNSRRGTLTIARSGELGVGLGIFGGTVEVSGNLSVRRLQMDRGVLTGPGTLVLASGGSTWTGGTMTGGGTTRIDSGATLSLPRSTGGGGGGGSISIGGIVDIDDGPSAPFALGDRRLVNNGTFELGGTLELNGIATIENAGAISIVNTGLVADSAEPPGTLTINNLGSFTLPAPGFSYELRGVTFNSTGALNVQAGLLRFSGTGNASIEGAVAIGPSGVIEQAGGTGRIDSPGIVSGQGILRVSDGQLTLAGGNFDQTLVLTNGSILIEAPVTARFVNMTGGDLSGSEPLTLTLPASEFLGGTVTVPIIEPLDTVAPTIVSSSLRNGWAISLPNGVTDGATIPATSVVFSKTMNESTLNAANFHLLTSGGLTVDPVSITVRNDLRAMTLAWPKLAPDTYRFVVLGHNVEDYRAGNQLAAGETTVATFEVRREAIPPVMVGTNLPGNLVVTPSFELHLQFSEAIDPSTLSAPGIQLSDGSNVYTPTVQSIDLDGAGVTLFLLHVPSGAYSLISDSIRDLSGNRIRSTGYPVSFEIADAIWIGTTGVWDDPTNWESGHVPQPTDRVYLSRPDAGSISVTGDVSVADIEVAYGTDLSISGGTWSVTDRLRFQGGGSLALGDGGAISGKPGQPLVLQGVSSMQVNSSSDLPASLSWVQVRVNNVQVGDASGSGGSTGTLILRDVELLSSDITVSRGSTLVLATDLRLDYGYVELDAGDTDDLRQPSRLQLQDSLIDGRGYLLVGNGDLLSGGPATSVIEGTGTIGTRVEVYIEGNTIIGTQIPNLSGDAPIINQGWIEIDDGKTTVNTSLINEGTIDVYSSYGAVLDDPYGLITGNPPNVW